MLQAAQVDRQIAAFLPAALEIVETPPSPLGRVTGATMLLAFCAAVAWAFIGQVDVVASTQGVVVPAGGAKVVQPFATGVVRAINVRDGQHVKIGDVLVELDPTIDQAQVNHLQSDLMTAKLDAARLRAIVEDVDDPLPHFKPPPGANALLAASEKQLLLTQAAEQRGKLAVFDRQRSQKEAEQTTASAEIAKLEAGIEILRKRVVIRRTLFEHGTDSEAHYLELYQLLVDQEKSLEVQHKHVLELQADSATLAQQRMQTHAEFEKANASALLDAEHKIQATSEDLSAAIERTKLQLLRAPVAGTIQQLSVHTIGGVVTPAQPLLVVVPDDAQLEVTAAIENADIGFVHVGEPAEIKVSAFDFTRYGLIHGKVVSVSQDAMPRTSLTGTPGADKGQNAAPANASSNQLVYSARIALDATNIEVGDRLAPISAGMTVTAEIKAGRRRIISYLFSPLAKIAKESFRER